MAILIVVRAAGSAAEAEEPRARPPEFTEEERSAFFDNAFEQLKGAPPVRIAAPGPSPREAPPAPGGRFVWEDVVDADTLETEIKRQVAQLAEAARSTAAYRAGGHRRASDSLGLLSLLFAVTAEHKESPRWRDAAASLRDQLGRAAQQADDPTDQAHAAASAQLQTLQDLVRGGRPKLPDAAGPPDWSELASREAIMKRMAEAEEVKLPELLAARRRFGRNAEEVRHEAQVLALLAVALIQPDAYDGDDPDYQAYSERLRDAADRLANAAEDENHEAAERAMTAVGRSCADCHADYRG